MTSEQGSVTYDELTKASVQLALINPKNLSNRERINSILEPHAIAFRAAKQLYAAYAPDPPTVFEDVVLDKSLLLATDYIPFNRNEATTDFARDAALVRIYLGQRILQEGQQSRFGKPKERKIEEVTSSFGVALYGEDASLQPGELITSITSIISDRIPELPPQGYLNLTELSNIGRDNDPTPSFGQKLQMILAAFSVIAASANQAQMAL